MRSIIISWTIQLDEDYQHQDQGIEQDGNGRYGRTRETWTRTGTAERRTRTDAVFIQLQIHNAQSTINTWVRQACELS